MNDYLSNQQPMVLVGPLVLASLLLSGSALAEPESVPAAQWCQHDDPAYYLTRRERLIEQGVRELDIIDCPAIEPATHLPQELVLPLPCGRRMVFREVPVPVEHLLDHYQAAFGSVPDQDDKTLLLTFSSGPWQDAIAGSFSRGPEGKPAQTDLSDLEERLYYLGKYEVTVFQYALYQAGLLELPLKGLSADAPECQAINEQFDELRATRVLPAGGLSWYDAVAFVRAWNEWLLALERQRIAAGLEPLLPWEQGSPGYVRLPTESEWEFAARGGLAGARAQDQGRRLYEVLDGDGRRQEAGRIEDLAVLSQSGDRNLTGGIGRRQPNLLGFYDMLGNVEEITLDMFRLTRPNSLHGQVGGYVVRGGSAISNPSALGVGIRREVPLHRLEGETKSELAGMRLAVVAPVFVGGVASSGERYQTGLQNPVLEERLLAARQTLADAAMLPGAEARNQLRSGLQQLRQEQGAGDGSGNQRLREQLAQLEANLEQSEAALQEAARTNLREKLKATVVSSTTIRSLGRLSFNILLKREEVRERIKDMKASERQHFESRLADFDRAWREMEEQIATQYSFFLSMIIDLALASPERFEQAATAVKSEFGARHITIYDDVWPLLEQQVTQARRSEGGISDQQRQEWRYQLDDTLKIREERFQKQ